MTPREIRRRPAQAARQHRLTDAPADVPSAVRAPTRCSAGSACTWSPGIEELDGATYRRVLPSGSVVAHADRRRRRDVSQLRIDDVRALPDTVARCRRMLDADADPVAVDATLAEDTAARADGRGARPGIRVPGVADGFELVVRTVLAQQVSLRAAHTFAGRLVEAYGKPLDAPVGSLTTRFPTADVLADASYDGIGLTGGRIKTLRAVAAAHAAGELPLDPSADRDETRARLLALPGIGPWTADYVAMRALGDPDAFPATRPRPAAARRRP